MAVDISAMYHTLDTFHMRYACSTSTQDMSALSVDTSSQQHSGLTTRALAGKPGEDIVRHVLDVTCYSLTPP